MKTYTAAQLIRRIQKVCKAEGVSLEETPVHFCTDCRGLDQIREIYVGGDSLPELVVINLCREP